MKRNYDWNIRILIKIVNCSRKIQLVCSVHTNIHQIKIEITKKLDISIFDSDIDLFYRGDRPLKSISTLLQNEIKNGDTLTANISRLKIIQRLDIRQKDKQKQGKNSEKIQMLGLTIVCCCTNKNCSNYNQDIEVNYGYGVFSILQITAETKCQFCPYKSQFLRPSMLCKSIVMNRCFYKLNGTQMNNCSIPISKETAFIKASKPKEIQTFIQQHPWNINMMLIVKNL